MAKKMKTLRPYRTYKFSGQDPICDKVFNVLDAVGAKVADVSRESGVASSTIGNWRKRKTKRPQFATLNATLMALDKELAIVNRK